jgi:ribonucleotide reductase beta subunit family protein with ferritin-like domain
MGLFDKRIAYKPFEYPEYYTEGWLKQAQAFWLHTEISMQSDIKDWKEKRTWSVIYYSALHKRSARFLITGPKR